MFKPLGAGPLFTVIDDIDVLITAVIANNARNSRVING